MPRRTLVRCATLCCATERRPLLDGPLGHGACRPKLWRRLGCAGALCVCLLSVAVVALVPCAVVTREDNGLCFSVLATVHRHTNCALDWSMPLEQAEARRAMACDTCGEYEEEQADAKLRRDLIFNPTPVFWSGYNGSACYRIPTIVASHAGTLIAFAEARLTACGDNNLHNLVLRRSTDGGVSWGVRKNELEHGASRGAAGSLRSQVCHAERLCAQRLIVVVEGTPPCAGCPAAISNPNPVAVRLRGGRHALLLHYNTLNNPSPAVHGVAMQLWSFDDGLTWERPSMLAYPPVPNIGGLIGPSVGLQAESGAIYFSARQPGAGTFLYFSVRRYEARCHTAHHPWVCSSSPPAPPSLEIRGEGTPVACPTDPEGSRCLPHDRAPSPPRSATTGPAGRPPSWWRRPSLASTSARSRGCTTRPMGAS